ncbi:MAG: hypothetical protein JO073_09075 [Actinobacteria bacterium]|nr:hypothetical protein [Actinomycetota bacterium]
MATIFLGEPDAHSRAVLAALIEALGHQVVYEPEDAVAAVIEPAYREAVSIVAERKLPVVCVTGRRRSITGHRLNPVAYLEKPVLVGPFVRAVAAATAA